MLIYSLLLLSTVSVLTFFFRTAWALRRYKYSPSVLTATKLPTISVCIAARNETHALARCLERIIGSDYAKLEILVLDDSSSDDTSLIIKSFASAGVRFIAGKELPNGWLGKNHAYQTLIDEASGDLVLFLDVDTVIHSTTISQLVSYTLTSNSLMVSVLPRREDGLRPSAVLGTMRYYWELLLGTNISPPASSALWLVQKDILQRDGISLSYYAQSVRPERHLARQISRVGNYRYIIGTNGLGISYEKRLASQYETAVRLYYPMNGRTLWRWAVASLFLLFLIVPLILTLSLDNSYVASVWSIILVCLVAFTFALFVRRTSSRVAWQLRVLLGPILMIQELGLLLYSYYKYRTNTVTWKGRQVSAQPKRHDSLSINE